MNRIIKHLVFATITFILISTVVYYFFFKKHNVNYEYGFKPQMAPNRLMTVEQMKEDLDYVVNVLRDVHPKTYNGFSNEQNLVIENAYKKINKIMKVGDFYFVLNEVICSLKDAHTMIFIELSKDDRIIDLPIVWLNDGMYIKEDTEQLKKGDKILFIRQKSEEDLLKELEKIIPAENQQWVKVRGKSNLIKEPFLRYLGLIENDYVNVKIQRDEKELEVQLPLIKNKKSKQNMTEEWVSYSVDKENSLGVFKLDTCNYDEKYKTTVANFFKEVSKYNIKNVAVDVRNNSGGDSRVVDEFLRYIDIDNYLSFSGDIRYSKQASEQRGYSRKSGYKSYRKQFINNKKVLNKELLFDGNVYIITSPRTFSSANWFAVIMKDNNIGKVIGEPTGNQPSSYGDVLRFQTHNSGFVFQVSLKRWVRPNTDNDPENCLHPDIEVYTTIEDIINERDPQVEKLIEIINE
ncbi:S41 family peptidase [Caldisalinibacter kiritimatiensis]|uniref:Tail specific protease domain-containing protein n=1 Tax=Caldisalinibacter kiritimatiensis TaxID=1304284 RepID=R1CWV6_9FIRM|nr:S41 family peptidase [Caldisalinibacter kiritimatiensis]EOD01109.1 hypothetical protein L21TH_0820 [Caldisalinibacter kiritimatiensis]